MIVRYSLDGLASRLGVTQSVSVLDAKPINELSAIFDHRTHEWLNKTFGNHRR